MKKLTFCFVLTAVLLFGAHALADMTPEPYPTFDATNFKADTSLALDLQFNGFSNVKLINVDLANNYFPTYYYSVNQTLSKTDAAAWGKAANMVSVFMRRMPREWIPFTQIQEIKLNGRYQARASYDLLYVVVTGPDKALVNKLAKELVTPASEPAQ